MYVEIMRVFYSELRLILGFISRCCADDRKTESMSIVVIMMVVLLLLLLVNIILLCDTICGHSYGTVMKVNKKTD